jgi:hypothetical protein
MVIVWFITRALRNFVNLPAGAHRALQCSAAAQDTATVHQSAAKITNVIAAQPAESRSRKSSE